MRKKRIIVFLSLAFLVLLHVIVLYSLFQPEKEWALSEEQKETVMRIATAYVEENYGTDYVINGNITINSYSEGGGLFGENVYNYPMASFIVPTDLTQIGISVHVLVDPEKGKVVKVWTATSHAP